jgi:molecular chaperone DnaK
MGILAGIDFGTSTSEIAVFKDGRPEFIRDVRQSRSGILPSVVALGPTGKPIVGEMASRAYDTLIREVKRSMGEDVTHRLGDGEYRPEEIASFVLRHLKENAERVEGDTIDEAVITVPAAFRDAQRQATLEAAKLAGLNVERVINEPTAAALAYGLNSLDTQETVLVFDLGGGTLDVTVLKMVKGILEVLASTGDDRLGGSDFDDVMFDLLARDIEQQSDYTVDRDRTSKPFNQLKEKSELAKIDLSATDHVSIDLAYLGDRSIDFHTVISRREFELSSRSLIDRMEPLVLQALKDAKLTYDDVDVILLVGGSTRIPAVRDHVSELFGGRTLPQRVPPDEAVALGAAIQMGLKAGAIDSRTGLVATDVTPHSLGVAVIEIQGGVPIPDRMSVIVERQTTKPVRATKPYFTLVDNQTEIRIRVFEGEHSDTTKNTLVGEFQLDGIPPGPAGTEAIDISIGVDINGRVDVEGVVVSTQASAALTIEPDARRMSAEELSESQRKLDQQWKESKLFARVEPILAAATRTKSKIGVSAEDVRRIEELEEKIKAALAANDEAAIERLEDELTDLLFDLQ